MADLITLGLSCGRKGFGFFEKKKREETKVLSFMCKWVKEMILGSFVSHVPLSHFSDRQGTAVLLAFDMGQK